MGLDGMVRRDAEATGQSAFIFPFRHKRVPAEQDHGVIASGIESRQDENEEVVQEVHGELMEKRVDALARVSEEIKRLTRYVRQHGRALAEQVKREGATLDEFKHRILSGRVIGSPLSAIAFIPNPQSGFAKESLGSGFAQNKDGSIMVTVDPISMSEMSNLREFIALNEAIEDKIGPGYSVSFEERDGDEQDSVFFKKELDEDDTEVQRLTFSVVVDCSGAGHSHDAGEDELREHIK